MTTLPYDIYVVGQYLQNFKSARKGVTVDGGVEVTMVNEICKVGICPDIETQRETKNDYTSTVVCHSI